MSQNFHTELIVGQLPNPLSTQLEQLQNPQHNIGRYTHHLFSPSGLALISMLGAYLLIPDFSQAVKNQFT